MNFMHNKESAWLVDVHAWYVYINIFNLHIWIVQHAERRSVYYLEATARSVQENTLRIWTVYRQ